MMEQRSDEWFTARLGKVTASCIYKVMARTKTGFGADRANYAAQLVSERLTGSKADSFSNSAMAWGTDTEPMAREAYAHSIGEAPVEIGFIDHPHIPMSGASPDGLVGFDGMLEVKCPQPATHLATLDGAGIDRKYVLQMQWQMACAERDWCDFASFDPRWPEPMRLHVRRVPRDEALIAEIEAEVTAFLAEVEMTTAGMFERYLQREAA